MPFDDRTTNRSYKLPNAGNFLADDVTRLRDALNAIDADIFARYTKTEVDTLINGLIAGAPGALNTLDELAAALGDDANFAATVTNLLALKANIADVYTKAEADARYVQGSVQTEMVFIATANQSVFALTTAIINKPSALVTVDGVVQPTSEYSLNMTGTQLTLSEGVPVGTIVRVLALGVASQGAPADDTVTTPKLRDAAVTTAKIADAAVTANKLANNSVNSDKIADGSVGSAELEASVNASLVPAGTVHFFAGSSAPTGWLKANGAAISRTTYAALFAAIGTTYGAGNGSTTFNLPDMRGEFPRGWDDGRGADSGRSFGSFQDGTWTRQLMNDWSDSDVSGGGNFVGQSFANHDGLTNSIPSNSYTGNGATFGSSMNDNASSSPFSNTAGVLGTWIRYRPRNIALLAIIKF